MKNFTCVDDVEDVHQLIKETIELKKDPFRYKFNNKTIGLVFFNPSLRTRMSTQKAALNMGVNVMVLNIGQDGWKIELEDGAVMNGNSQEHIKDAVKVMSGYCDLIAVRTFAGLINRDDDYNEKVLNAFLEHSAVPVISLESATRHPLQSLADLVTIQEQGISKPKITLSWAPHPKALPQAVPNSFLEWVKKTDAEVCLAFPKGYELKESFMEGLKITHDQNGAIGNSDFVYAKNWSSYSTYGTMTAVKEDWTITKEKMELSNRGKFMHCLPIRRNVIASDEVIENSLIYQQAKNREFSVQVILKKLLDNG